MTAAAPPARQKKPRDPRLDFFRGLAMFIIFIAHVPGNSWFLFIPARFGFSSAAELFVFCSGVASGFAFGMPFLRLGFLTGALRVVQRLWQVYWAHIGLMLTMIAVSIAGYWLTGRNYTGELGLSALVAAPLEGIFGLVSLRYILNFNDILPLYLILLAAIVPVMALARISPGLALAGIGALWLVAHLGQINLHAVNGGGAGWYFSPFAWQGLFFAGFAFAMGWLPVPALRRGWLFGCAVVALIVSVPLNFWAILEAWPAIDAFRNTILPEGNQMYLSPLRMGHFLCLAYVALVLVEPYRERLWQARWVILVGQQSLPAFLASTTLMWVAGMVLDLTGRGMAATALVNLAGFAAIIAVARVAAYFKAPPWRGSGG